MVVALVASNQMQPYIFLTHIAKINDVQNFQQVLQRDILGYHFDEQNAMLTVVGPEEAQLKTLSVQNQTLVP